MASATEPGRCCWSQCSKVMWSRAAASGALPGGGSGHCRRRLVEAPHRRDQLLGREESTIVAPGGAFGQHVPFACFEVHVAPCRLVGKPLHRKLAGQRLDRVLTGPDPTPSKVDGTVADVDVVDAPPTRSRASSTTTSRPAVTRVRAALRPARPAPTTTTSVVASKLDNRVVFTRSCYSRE